MKIEEFNDCYSLSVGDSSETTVSAFGSGRKHCDWNNVCHSRPVQPPLHVVAGVLPLIPVLNLNIDL